MADRMDLMVKMNAELHQFTRDHPAAVSDPNSESAYHYIKMQRICVLLSLLPMGAEKLNVLMDMDNHDTLQSILYFSARTAMQMNALMPFQSAWSGMWMRSTRSAGAFP